jgi:uncharacterized membrane protein
MSERASATPPIARGDDGSTVEARSAGNRPRGWEVALRGLPGHPLHPPFTDATIGMFVLATGLAVIGSAGAIKVPAGKAMWLALIGGLIVALPTTTTGLIDWLFIDWGSARWRTATAHMSAMVTAVVLFALAAWRQHPGYVDGRVTTAGLVLSLAGLAVLTVGGWLGGSVVFVHGMRVLGTSAEQARTAGEDQDNERRFAREAQQ